MADTFDVNKKKRKYAEDEVHTKSKNTLTPIAETTVDNVDDPKRRKQGSDDVNSSSEYSSSEGQDEYTSTLDDPDDMTSPSYSPFSSKMERLLSLATDSVFGSDNDEINVIRDVHTLPLVNRNPEDDFLIEGLNISELF
ncbi:10686_t:CDS:2 [Funneliformis mosseae]|uniref:10686_t:CDS:1 n=1 Tax=Funneliformis mosseae TaxID=27381 RepID=A0A9N8WHJ9_FUNMO|nr:10686_t:CDS:2 [Funneliformis mosseae]